MSPLNVPAYAVANGALASVDICPLHGRPAVGTRRMTFTGRTPPWVWLLLLVGVLIAVIVAAAVRPKATGQVPECDLCVTERQARTRNVLVLWLASGCLLAGTVAATSHPTLSLVLLGLLVVAVIAALVAMARAGGRGVQGSVSKDGYWVTVEVEDSYFAAVQRAMQGAVPPPPPPPPPG